MPSSPLSQSDATRRLASGGTTSSDGSTVDRRRDHGRGGDLRASGKPRSLPRGAGEGHHTAAGDHRRHRRSGAVDNHAAHRGAVPRRGDATRPTIAPRPFRAAATSHRRRVRRRACTVAFERDPEPTPVRLPSWRSGSMPPARTKSRCARMLLASTTATECCRGSLGAATISRHGAMPFSNTAAGMNASGPHPPGRQQRTPSTSTAYCATANWCVTNRRRSSGTSGRPGRGASRLGHPTFTAPERYADCGCATATCSPCARWALTPKTT